MLLERIREIPALAPTESAEHADSYSAVVHLHAYQPPRKLVLEGKEIFNITCPEYGRGGINEKIWQESYAPIMENIAASPLVSFDMYGTLRDWMKVKHPNQWQSFIEGVVDKKSHSLILGDPYLHLIFPLVPQTDKTLLINIGVDAFKQDFGFYPLGFWLPETAVDEGTLEALAAQGIKFVLLREDQVTGDRRAASFNISTSQGDIQAFVFNRNFSDTVGFGDIYNADYFALNLKQNGLSRIANDWETYGHQRKHGSYLFLKHLVNCSLPAQGVDTNSDNRDVTNVQIKNRTSWSCEHNLGRYTGICDCDFPSPETRLKKQNLFLDLGEANDVVNKKLDKIYSNWRENFKSWFLIQRLNLASGKSVDSKGVGKKYKNYFYAKFLYFVGTTSCAWFFGKEGSIERQIAENSLREIRTILELES